MERAAFSYVTGAQYVGISERLFRQKVRDGEIPAVNIGRRVVIPRVALDQWMLAQATAQTAQRSAESAGDK